MALPECGAQDGDGLGGRGISPALYFFVSVSNGNCHGSWRLCGCDDHAMTIGKLSDIKGVFKTAFFKNSKEFLFFLFVGWSHCFIYLVLRLGRLLLRGLRRGVFCPLRQVCSSVRKSCLWI